MKDFDIVELDNVTLLHLEYEDVIKIKPFDSTDEAFQFLLNNEELISFWKDYETSLAELN